MDATVKGLLGSPAIWDDFRLNIDTGLSQDPATMADGSFWAYFHRSDDLRTELADAGLDTSRWLPSKGSHGCSETWSPAWPTPSRSCVPYG